ncbi:MAG TPA: hypothetical protein VKU02_11225 [Gemmataceae bacterium]|nr:hypothetical protein [Gemmataceae bacterium]
MNGCASSLSRANHRPAIYRLTLEELESRLPPGDMIGLSGMALWGMNLGVDGRGLRIAPLAMAEVPLVGRDTHSGTASHARDATRTPISLVPTSPTAALKPADVTPASEAKQVFADADLYQCGLVNPFDGSRPAPSKPRAPMQGGMEHANQGDLLRSPMPGGGESGSRVASSPEAMPQPPSSMATGNFPPLGAPLRGSTTQTKPATASAMPAPANPTGNVMSPGQGIHVASIGTTPGGNIHPDMPESDRPPPTPT